MWRQVRSERGRERTKEDFADEMRTNDQFLEFAAAWWPVLDAATVLGWLRDPDLLARVGRGRARRRGRAAPGEVVGRGALGRRHPAARRAALPPRRPADREHRLGRRRVPRRRGRLAAGGVHRLRPGVRRPRGWTPPTNRVEDDGYAHVLVDEAQDLTPMQWRMVGRRGRAATWTIVGDPAQSSWPVPAEAAAAREAALGDKPRHDFHLSTNYRNSSEIYDFAAAYAERVGLDADLPDAVRSTGVEPAELRVDDLESAVRDHLTELAGSLEGTVGIVVPGRPPRRGHPLGRLLARGRRRAARPTRGRRAHRPGHQGPRVRRHRRGRSRRRSRTSPPPAAPPSTSSTPAPPSGWSPSPRRRPRAGTPSPPTGDQRTPEPAERAIACPAVVRRVPARRRATCTSSPGRRADACREARSRPSSVRGMPTARPDLRPRRSRGADGARGVGGDPVAGEPDRDPRRRPLSRLEKLGDIPLEEGVPEDGRRFDRLVAVPFRQVTERGFVAHDDGTPLAVVEIETEREVPLDGAGRGAARRRGRLRGRGRLRDQRRGLRPGRGARSSTTRSATARARTSSSAGTTARSCATGTATRR